MDRVRRFFTRARVSILDSWTSVEAMVERRALIVTIWRARKIVASPPSVVRGIDNSAAVTELRKKNQQLDRALRRSRKADHPVVVPLSKVTGLLTIWLGNWGSVSEEDSIASYATVRREFHNADIAISVAMAWREPPSDAWGFERPDER